MNDPEDGMLERREAETFLALAGELHFGRTAERLRVSTAQVSQTVRKLERRIGVPLFTRTSRRVELSPAGRRLLADLEPAWTALEAAVRRAIEDGRGTGGALRAGFGDAAAAQLLAGAAERVEGPVELRETRLADLLPWLRDGEVDVALTTLPVDDPLLATGPVLVRELRFLAVPAGHPFARADAVRAADLARTPVLRPPLQDAWLDAHATGDRGPSGASLQELLTLVGAGKGVVPVGAHVRRYHPRPDVAYVPFADAPRVEWVLAWRADSATARVRAFARAAADVSSP